MNHIAGIYLTRQHIKWIFNFSLFKHHNAVVKMDRMRSSRKPIHFKFPLSAEPGIELVDLLFAKLNK